MASTEVGRQLVHIAVGAFALALRFLTWWQAALFAAAAVLGNAVVLPRVAPALFRTAEDRRPLTSGIVIYPLAILALILLLPHRLDLVAVTWAILAAGDGSATLVGAHTRTAPLPWNRAKSAGGLVSFILCGGAAGVGLAAWNHPDVAMSWSLAAAPLLAAVVAGFIETTPIRLDDNISVPAAAAVVLWSLAHVTAEALGASLPEAWSRLPVALMVNVVVAAAGWRARAVTVAGAVTGALIGTAIYLGAGWRGWTLLFASFALASAATRAGHRRKAGLGIAEDRGGRRGPGNALANTGVGAWAALVALGAARPDLALVAMAAALVTASSDTVASEVGKAWGQTTWLVVGFRRVAPGTSGAVSLEGTAAGFLAAAALAALAAAIGLVPASAVAVIVIAATLASLVESALGATLEAPGILNNDALNFLNSAIGAGIALAAWSLV
jgi:uncharacterized protein (TIGR00297 family)